MKGHNGPTINGQHPPTNFHFSKMPNAGPFYYGGCPAAVQPILKVGQSATRGCDHSAIAALPLLHRRLRCASDLHAAELEFPSPPSARVADRQSQGAYAFANSFGWSTMRMQTARSAVVGRALICFSASCIEPSVARWVVMTIELTADDFKPVAQLL